MTLDHLRTPLLVTTSTSHSKREMLRVGLLDLKVGYVVSAVLAVVFVSLGANLLKPRGLVHHQQPLVPQAQHDRSDAREGHGHREQLRKHPRGNGSERDPQLLAHPQRVGILERLAVRLEQLAPAMAITTTSTPTPSSITSSAPTMSHPWTASTRAHVANGCYRR